LFSSESFAAIMLNQLRLVHYVFPTFWRILLFFYFQRLLLLSWEKKKKGNDNINKSSGLAE
jgi:hypothetical protein